MGSKSKSRTSTNTTVNDNTTTNTDNSITEIDLAEGAFNAGDISGAVSITQTDQGAIDAAVGLGITALDNSNDALEGGYGLAETAILSQQELAAGGYGLAETAILSQQELAADAVESAATSQSINAQHFSDGLAQVLSFAQTANTSEDGQISQGLIKWGALALVAVFVVLQIPNIAKVVK